MAAHGVAEQASNTSVPSVDELKVLTYVISDLTTNSVSASDVNKVVKEVGAARIATTPYQIQRLEGKIQQALLDVSDVELIRDETEDHLRQLEVLKQSAATTKLKADQVLGSVQRVRDAVASADKLQQTSSKATDATKKKIHQIEQDFETISSNADMADSTSLEMARKMSELRRRLARVKQQHKSSEINTNTAQRLAKDAAEIMSPTEKEADDLKVQYTKMKEQLDKKSDQTMASKQRADKLTETARIVSTGLAKYQDVESAAADRERLLRLLSRKMGSLNAELSRLVRDIGEVAVRQDTCTF